MTDEHFFDHLLSVPKPVEWKIPTTENVTCDDNFLSVRWSPPDDYKTLAVWRIRFGDDSFVKLPHPSVGTIEDRWRGQTQRYRVLVGHSAAGLEAISFAVEEKDGFRINCHVTDSSRISDSDVGWEEWIGDVGWEDDGGDIIEYSDQIGGEGVS